MLTVGGCSRHTVQRIWTKIKKNLLYGERLKVEPQRKGNCGRKRLYVVVNRILIIPYRRRKSKRATTAALGVSTTTIFKLIKEGNLKPHSNAIKPTLTEQNMKSRLEWCLQSLDINNFDEMPQFQDMYDTIHVDEKWFYLTKGNQRYYLLPCEKKPYKHCKTKRFIAKVMFLAAIARPRFNANGECIFDGKLGMWPFVRWVPAKRRSKYRPTGTPEVKPINPKDAYRAMLIEKVLPAMLEKLLVDREGPIYIQQDNATSHIKTDDAEC